MEELMNQVLSIADKHLGDYRISNGQVIAKYCPFCNGGEHGDTNTFYVGLRGGAFYCHRGQCAKSGSFVELCNYFGERANISNIHISVQKKEYSKPNEDMLHPVSDEALSYFATRHISQETVEHFSIKTDDRGNIVFPFYRDGVLTYVKYRKPRKAVKGQAKEWQMSNTESILFNMDNIDVKKPLYITEGQIDAMSLYEAGVTNVTSVPCGADNTDWIQNCWDWLEQFDQIIIFGDSDEPGVRMTNTVSKRLGEYRCLMPPKSYPNRFVDGIDSGLPCKDANEILFFYGPETLKNVADQCEPTPVAGILELSKIQFVDPSSLPRIHTRIPELDELIAGLGEGGLTVFSGKRGEGKSTLGGSLLLNAIEEGYKVCAYSGQLSKQKFLEWIMCQATDDRYIEAKSDNKTGKVYAVPTQEAMDRIRDWLDNKFYLYDNEYVVGESQDKAIIDIFTVCAKRFGCKLFLVDNLMSSLISSDEENRAQAKFSAALKQFAVKYKAHVLLVAHPRKTKSGEQFTSDDVSGSSAITNLADNVINVEKPNLRVTKNRDYGTTGLINCMFNPANRRIYSKNYGDKTIYGWDHTGISVPENQACKLPAFQPTGAEQGPF